VEALAKVQAAGSAEAEARFRAKDARARKRANAGEEGDGEDAAGRKGRSNKGRIKLKALPEGPVNLAKEQRKVRLLARRQERLLFPCLHLLLNLAEDSELERKMCRRDVVGLLLGLLSRAHRELLLLAATFLRKLSLIEENKDAMAEQDVVARIARWVPSGDTPLTLAMLRLAFNLSFDRAQCARMVEVGLLPRIASLLRHGPFRAVVLRILYHVSIDDA